MGIEYRTLDPSMITELAYVINTSGKDQPYFVPTPPEQLRVALLENPDYDPEGAAMAFDQGRAVAAGIASWSKSRVEYGLSQGMLQIAVVPERRGNGIEQELMKRSLAYFKRKELKEAIFASNVVNAWKLELAKGFGFSEMRRGYRLIRPMSVAVPAIAVPDGISFEIRDLKDAGMDFINDFLTTLNVAFKDHFNFAPLTMEQAMLIKKIPGIDALCILARTGDGRPVGVCLGMIERQNAPHIGDINAIGVVSDHRRKGIAKAMMLRVLSWFAEQGMKEAILGMEAQNSRALSLYTQLGFEIKSESITFRLPLVD